MKRAQEIFSQVNAKQGARLFSSVSRYISVQDVGEETKDAKIDVEFNEFKHNFAKKLVQDRKELKFADMIAICKPLAVELIVSEPILWSSFANLALSQNSSTITFQDVVTLAWSFGKI